MSSNSLGRNQNFNKAPVTHRESDSKRLQMNSAQGIIGEMKTPKRTPMLKSRGTSNAKIMG